MTERWRTIPEFPEHEASNLGRVRSTARRVEYNHHLTGARHSKLKAAKVLAPQIINSGYLVVHMWSGNKRVARTVHGLVAQAFHGPRPEGYDVAHRNGDRTDNRATNLRYLTRKANHAEKKLHGTQLCGEQVNLTKLTVEQVLSIREDQRLADSVAKDYGVSRSQVYRIRNREDWSHV